MPLPRTSRDWVPPDDDEYTYAYRGGRWVRLDDDERGFSKLFREVLGEWTDEDEAGLEEFEERRRERIARENEY